MTSLIKLSFNFNLIFFLLVSASSQAQIGDLNEDDSTKPGEFGGTISFQTEFSDNTLKAPFDELDERQDTYKLDLNGRVQGDFFKADMDYRAEEKQFAEDSQNNKSTLEGESSLSIGKSSDLMSFVAKHSRKTILNNPDDLDLLENTDERDMLSASPRLNWNVTGLDSVRVAGNFSKFTYQDDGSRGSESKGASLSWIHRLSAVSQFGLIAQGANIEFEDSLNGEYDYELYNLSYAAKLRLLSYQIQFGYNKASVNGGDDLGGLQYRVNLIYKTTNNHVELTTSQVITDASQGDGNTNPLGSLLSNASGAADAQGVLELLSTEVSWETKALCSRCTFGLGAGFKSEEYKKEAVNNRDEIAYTFKFSYAMNRALTLNLRWKMEEQKFESASESMDYEVENITASINYAFNEALSAKLFAESETRSSGDSEKQYNENVAGASISYRF